MIDATHLKRTHRRKPFKKGAELPDVSDAPKAA